MQKQPDLPTVQGEIENALKRLNINPNLIHAGRTDRGVHALNQVITFNAPNFWDLVKLKNELNKILHPHIMIKKLQKCPDSFHPRYDAKKRSYRYIFSNLSNPFINDLVTFYPNPINITLLKSALKMFEGTHDFSMFAKTGSDVKSYVRNIYKTDIFTHKHLTVVKFYGNGFLRSQIRLIINALIYLNEQKITLSELQEQIECKKTHVKIPAKPNGLYLERIWY